MKRQLLFLSFAILLTFLFACNTINSITPTTISETSIGSSTFTASPQTPTSSPYPTFNLTEEAWMDTLDITREAELISEEATQQVNIALATQFPSTCYRRDMSLSPDGNWLAVSCDIDEQIKIASKNGNKVWQIDYNTLFTPSEDMPDVFINAWISHWSKDSRYVYIDWSICCWDPGGPVFYSLTNLERFDTVIGNINYVLSGNVNYSFSPTDRRLIEIQEPASPIVLQIHDLNTGEETELTLELDSKYEQAGLITWAPDGLRFVILAAYGEDIRDFTETMILVDVRELSQKILLENVRDYIGNINWSEDDVLMYTTTDYSGIVPVISEWSRDMNTLEFVTPTLKP